MIRNTDSGIAFLCDDCPTEFVTEEFCFREALEKVREEGWKSVQMAEAENIGRNGWGGLK